MDFMDSGNGLKVFNDALELRSEERTQFIDLTGWVSQSLSRAEVGHGLAQIQVMHTTAAIIVNENEPLLLEDFKAMFERLAPGDGGYAHDDLRRRCVNLVPGERANGHAHARALILGGSRMVNVREGRLDLGRWQSIFLVELDGPRDRKVSLTVLGFGRSAA